MTTITHLPNEIITLILENKNISVEDIVNLKYTCKRLQHITFSTNFWKKKYYQRFPLSEVIYSKKRLEKIFKHLEAGVKCIGKLQRYVSLMSCDNLQRAEQMELNSLLRSIAENSIIYSFVLEDINRIISAQLPGHDLTVKYYFSRICRWLKQYRLVYKYTKFICMPKEKLILEKLIIIIAQIFQPYVSYSIFDTWLNNIVQVVLSRLQDIYPTHSAFSTSSEKFTFWRNNNIDDNFWNQAETKQIKHIFEEIIFSKLGVQLHELLVTFHFEEECIQYILKRFQECLLPIMYHIIARRLGLCCFLNYKHVSSMEIIWNPTRRICTIKRPLHLLYNILQIRKLIDSLTQFGINFNLCTDLQMQRQVSYKWEITYILKFLSLYLRKDIKNTQIVVDMEYECIIRSIKLRSKMVINKQPKIPNKHIKFAIGMIVTHLPIADYTSCEIYIPHDGVIIGWDYECKAEFVQKNLNFLFPHLDECYKKHTCLCTCQSWRSHSTSIHQPHYVILEENNTICYAPQDMIRMCQPKWINNVEIGRYFSKFDGTSYVPN